MRKKIGNIVKFVFFVGLGIFFIYWFLSKLTADEKAQIWQAFDNVNYFWVAVVFVTGVISHVVRALRWRLLFEPLDYKPRVSTTFGAVMIAYLANLAVPRLGEVLRCGVLNQYEKIPIQTSLGTVVTERIIDLIGFALTVLLGLVLEFNLLKDYLYDALSQKMAVPSLATLALVGVLGLVLCIVLYRIFRKKLMQIPLFLKVKTTIIDFWQGIKSILYLRRPWLFVIYSLLIYFLYFLGGYIAFKVLPETMHLTLVSALMVYIFGSVGMMVTPGGIGLYPALIAETLAIYKITKPIGYALGWISWGVQQIVTLVFGMGYLIALPLMKKKNDKTGNQ
ncbi:MAG: flippase-like domain-containing protein [Bacteroidales bacterium]|nr:flippase-like domain-containing protein [Bacteroidales bacterium]